MTPDIDKFYVRLKNEIFIESQQAEYRCFRTNVAQTEHAHDGAKR